LPLCESTKGSLESGELTGLIITLARALHRVGQPAHRIEQTLELAAQRLGVELQIFSLPTGILLTMTSDRQPSTFAIREPLSKIDLERLVQVTAAADEFIRGTMSPQIVKL